MTPPTSPHLALARKLAGLFAALPNVEAIGLGGSQTSGARTDPASDIDLCVYTTGLVPLEARLELVKTAGASRADMNLSFWDLGDEWFDAETGIEVDAIYWPTHWMEEQIERVLVQHQPSLGYTTCFWHTVRNTQVLFDKNGWLQGLIARAGQPYPPELRQAIISKNFSVLRDVIPSYTHQIEKAVQRGDLVSINHRLAAMLASYFDVLFALNWLTHPGEKRLLALAAARCEKQPPFMVQQVESVLQAAASGSQPLVATVNSLVDGLEALLQGEGLI